MAYQVDFHVSSPFIAVGIPQHILTTRSENPAAAQQALPVSSLHIRSDFSIGIIPLPISFVIMIKSGFSRWIVLVSAAPSLVPKRFTRSWKFLIARQANTCSREHSAPSIISVDLMLNFFIANSVFPEYAPPVISVIIPPEFLMR